MIILWHHLMTKGVHNTLSYVHAHCLHILFGLELLSLLRDVCLYMRLFNRIMHYLSVYVLANDLKVALWNDYCQ